jgi:hypothetical protein
MAILKHLYAVKLKKHEQLTKRGLKIGPSISFEVFKQLSLAPCLYCGENYSLEAWDDYSGAADKPLSDTIVKYNGIDRINSVLGYEDGNCVPCCRTCNLAKNTMSQTEFYTWIEKVYRFSIEKHQH